MQINVVMRACAAALAAVVVVSVPAVQAQTPQKLTVTSPTLKDGEPVPLQHTPYGRNDSPALTWSAVPNGTRELVVICEDPDAGNPPPFVHWVMYKIPPTATGLPEGLPLDNITPLPPDLRGAIQGLSGFRRPTYRGPAPPPGKVHHYHFVVYAIDIALPPLEPMTPPMTRAEILDAIKGHVVAQGELVATYERK
jgi:Raf kinase inhibitor-like YbhB/YbcL family protein